MKFLIYLKSLPYSEPALILGAKIARSMGATITLLAVTPSVQDKRSSDELFTKAKEKIGDLEIQATLRRGTPVMGILAEINSGSYDFVVTQARQAIRYRHRLGRRLGRLIAQKSRTSVLVVKEPRAEIKKILVCTGGLDIAVPVLKIGGELAAALKADTTILHVPPSVPSMYTGLHEIEETLPELLQSGTPTGQHLRKAAEQMSQYNIKSELKIRHGVVADEIIDEAETYNYDLVVLGASKPGNWVLGSVTQDVVNHSRCPVLVVRATMEKSNRF